jgi:hypothetical protein
MVDESLLVDESVLVESADMKVELGWGVLVEFTGGWPFAESGGAAGSQELRVGQRAPGRRTGTT